MRLITSGEQRNIELAATTHNVTVEDMVRRAGDAVFNYVRQKYQISGMGIAVLCGKGGNASDGFAVASRLLAVGARPVVILCNGQPEGDVSAAYYKEAVDKGVAVLPIDGRFDQALQLVQRAGLIIDAVFGIGFSGLLAPGVAALFDAANQSPAPVISIDVPSGLDADGGSAAPGAVKAAATLCMVGEKPVHVLRSAAKYCGEIIQVDIGLPEAAYTAVKRTMFMLTRDVVAKLLPVRAQDTHKYDFGSLVCAVGSGSYRGAAVLCTKGALLGGAGLVQVASDASVLNAVAAHCPEAILLDIYSDADAVTRALDRATACVVGCGLPDDWTTDRVVSWLLTDTKGTAVVDAGALDTVKRALSMLKERRSPTIVTPHVGEFARMLNEDSGRIYADRLRRALAFAVEQGVVVVLKSDNTVIALPNGELYLNDNGNSGLAKGGSGDLLSGLIGSLCASGVTAANAALLGVYLHASAADLAAGAMPQQAITPSIVADFIPSAISELSQHTEEVKKTTEMEQTMAMLDRVRTEGIPLGDH